MRNRPLRHPLAKLFLEAVTTGRELGAAPGEHRLEVAQEVRRDELLEDRGPEVARGPRTLEALDERGLGADPADPHPSPHGLAERADEHRRAVGRERELGRGSVDAQFSHGLIGDHDGALPVGEREHPLPKLRRHHAAGGIVEVGHRVGDRRARALQRLLEAVLVPTVVTRDRDGNEPPARHPERVESMRVAGRFDQRAVAAAEQHPREQGYRMLGADRDHDLVRPGLEAAHDVPVGDRLAQERQPDRVEPRIAEVGRKGVGRSHSGIGEVGRRGQGSLAEVEVARGETADRDGLATGEARDAARAAHAVEMPRGPKVAVGGGHRRTAHSDAGGEVAFGRKPGAHGDAAVEDEHADAISEGHVGRDVFSGTPARQKSVQYSR